MSRALFKKKSPQHTAAFREGHPGLKHGKQAWEDQGDGTRVMRYYNAYLPTDTLWDERWSSGESFFAFESARKVKPIRHYRGERVSPPDDKTVSFEEHLATAIARERGKLPEGESSEPVPMITRTEKVGHRPDPRRHPGVSGLEAYA